jgi:hypothetical protein
MGNKLVLGYVMIVMGIIGLNLFYAWDLLVGDGVILLGPKSLMAITAANAVTLVGTVFVARNEKR